MSTKMICLPLVLLVFMIGCLPSLNPVYTEKQVVFEPAVIGQWKQENSNVVWDFRKAGEKAYQLVYTDNDGQMGRFVATLAEIEGQYFLDLYPEEVSIDANAFYRLHLVPIHTVYRVKSIEPEFVLSAIDGKWLESFLAENPDQVQHAKYHNRTLITAETAELQEFVTANEDAFTVDVVLERVAGSVN